MTSTEKELAHVDSLTPSDQQATGGVNEVAPTLPKAVLVAAADLIDRCGWWNGEGPEGDRHCAAMAIAAVTECGPVGDAACVAASDAFNRFIKEPDMARWNDRQPNGEAVIAALRACADSLEGH